MWVNYGDVNPIEHGGLWIRKDTDRETCYNVIKTVKMPETNGVTDAYWFYDLYVDLSDTWIDWNEVFEYASINDKSSNEDKVIALLEYYSHLNFGVEHCISLDELSFELEAHDIVVS